MEISVYDNNGQPCNELLCLLPLNLVTRQFTDEQITATKAFAVCDLVMIILVLLFSQISCDWVEISQNHYRKEPLHKVTVNLGTTQPNRIYRNHSLGDKHWNRGVVDKVSNVGNIRRVQLPSVKTSSLKTRYEDNEFNKNFDDHSDTHKEEYDIISVKPNIPKFSMYDDEHLDNQNQAIRTATNVDNVETDQLDSKHIKKLVKTAVVNNFIHRKPIDEDLTNVNINNWRKQGQSMKSPLIETNSKDIYNFNENDDLYLVTKPNIRRGSHNDEIKLALADKEGNKHFNVSNINKVITPNIKLIQRENNAGSRIKNVIENDVVYINNPAIASNTDYTEVIHTSNESPTRLTDDYFGATDINPNSNRTEDAKPVQNNHVENKKTTFSKPDDISNETKVNPMNGMWKLMKVVADTIYKNTHRSFKSKIKYLETLKSTIIMSIEDQIDRAWPDDGGSSRRARSAEARGHVEFPSSESTLMTISFLTFAVFLIKLVLQVINTYKNKTMMVTPTIVAAVGRAAAAFKTSK